MGPNGSGKSTLAAILAGREGYEITAGQVLYQGRGPPGHGPGRTGTGRCFSGLSIPGRDPRSEQHLFSESLRLNEIRKHNGPSRLDAMEFLTLVKDKMKLLELNQDLLRRSVNEGFSGGEKKRNEIFQMAVLEPKLAILDETDSGLDIDALKIVSNGVNKLRRPDNAQLVITHYQRLLNYIVP